MVTWQTLTLFFATVLPLVCTPGPDILFVSSQGLASQWRGALWATVGICSGYLVHSLLATLGLAAIIATSPELFELIRVAGAAYLIFIGLKLLYVALFAARKLDLRPMTGQLLGRGMITSILNPKGLLIYLAVLPQFVSPESPYAEAETLILALVFVGSCFVVYLAVGLSVAMAGPAVFGTNAQRATNLVAGTIVTALGARMALRF